MQSRHGYQEQQFYSRVEQVVEEHMYRDDYHHQYNNGPTMFMKPNRAYPQPKRGDLIRNKHGGHDVFRHGRDDHNHIGKYDPETCEEDYEEDEEEHREIWSKNKKNSDNKHHMNKLTSGRVPYGSRSMIEAPTHRVAEHRRPSYGYDENEVQREHSVWNFKGSNQYGLNVRSRLHF